MCHRSNTSCTVSTFRTRLTGFGAMKLLERVHRYIGALIFGIIAAFFLATLVDSFWPNARNIAFVLLSIFWLTGLIQVVVRDIRSQEDKVLSVAGVLLNFRWNSDSSRAIRRSSSWQLNLGHTNPSPTVMLSGTICRREVPFSSFCSYLSVVIVEFAAFNFTPRRDSPCFPFMSRSTSLLGHSSNDQRERGNWGAH